MTTGAEKKIARIAIAAVIAAPALLLAGCYEDDYLSRRDTVTLGAGDAAATNAATHTIDPWPPQSKNTNINVDGARVQVGMDRYQQNNSIRPKGLGASSGSNGDSGNGGGGNGAQITN
jgi:hypothetical protein